MVLTPQHGITAANAAWKQRHALGGADRSRRTLSITASQQERAARKGKTKCEDSFEATPRRLSDGSFVSWLERMLLGDGGSKVPQAALAEP
jgi:hypothetical protein